MDDAQILDFKVGERAIKDMGSLEFLGWLSKKINGVSSYSAGAVELTAAISSPPISSNMPETEKIRLVRKLLSIGVTL